MILAIVVTLVTRSYPVEESFQKLGFEVVHVAGLGPAKNLCYSARYSVSERRHTVHHERVRISGSMSVELHDGLTRVNVDVRYRA